MGTVFNANDVNDVHVSMQNANRTLPLDGKRTNANRSRDRDQVPIPGINNSVESIIADEGENVIIGHDEEVNNDVETNQNDDYIVFHPDDIGLPANSDIANNNGVDDDEISDGEDGEIFVLTENIGTKPYFYAMPSTLEYQLIDRKDIPHENQLNSVNYIVLAYHPDAKHWVRFKIQSYKPSSEEFSLKYDDKINTHILKSKALKLKLYTRHLKKAEYYDTWLIFKKIS